MYGIVVRAWITMQMFADKNGGGKNSDTQKKSLSQIKAINHFNKG